MKHVLKRIMTAILMIAMTVGLLPICEKEVEAATIVIRYELNGGTVSVVNSKTYDEKKVSAGTVTISKGNYYNPGYKIIGWAEKKGGAKKYNPGQQTTLKKGITLYAIWGCDHSNYTQQIIRYPSCTVSGTARCTCKKCGATFEKTLVAKGHPGYSTYKKDGKMVVECRACTVRRTDAMSLDEFVKCWKEGKKGFWDYSKEERSSIQIAWMSYNFNMKIDEAKNAYAVYDGGGSNLGLECKDATKLLTFMKNMNSLANFDGFKYAKDCAGVLKRASLIVALVDPDKTTAEKVKSVLSYINPMGVSILDYYVKIYDSMEILVSVDASKVSSLNLALSIEKVTGQSFQNVDFNTFVSNLDAICKAQTAECGSADWAEIYAKRGHSLFRNSYYQTDYDAIQYAMSYYADKEFKKIFPEYEGTFKEYLNNTKSVDSKLETIGNKIGKFISKLIPNIK